MADGSRRPPARSARASAVDLLARREHSRGELAAKLTRRGHPPDEVEAALDALTQAGYLSDQRFAEAYVRTRSERGQGPLRIRAGLRERHVDDALAATALQALDGQWLALCARQRIARFGVAAPRDRREWLRQARFLAGRGFSEAQVRAVLRDADDGVGEETP